MGNHVQIRDAKAWGRGFIHIIRINKKDLWFATAMTGLVGVNTIETKALGSTFLQLGLIAPLNWFVRSGVPGYLSETMGD